MKDTKVFAGKSNGYDGFYFVVYSDEPMAGSRRGQAPTRDPRATAIGWSLTERGAREEAMAD